MPTNPTRTDSVTEAFAFARAVLRMTGGDIRRLAASGRAGDDVAWWHAVVAVDHRLRRARLVRQGTMAGRAATQAVLIAASRSGLDLDADVIAVARAAADAARAVVAGGLRLRETDALLVPWAELGVLGERTGCPTA
jgi:hypothetical protein